MEQWKPTDKRRTPSKVRGRRWRAGLRDERAVGHDGGRGCRWSAKRSDGTLFGWHGIQIVSRTVAWEFGPGGFLNSRRSLTFDAPLRRGGPCGSGFAGAGERRRASDGRCGQGAGSLCQQGPSLHQAAYTCSLRFARLAQSAEHQTLSPKQFFGLSGGRGFEPHIGRFFLPFAPLDGLASPFASSGVVATDGVGVLQPRLPLHCIIQHRQARQVHLSSLALGPPLPSCTGGPSARCALQTCSRVNQGRTGSDQLRANAKAKLFRRLRKDRSCILVRTLVPLVLPLATERQRTQACGRQHGRNRCAWRGAERSEGARRGWACDRSGSGVVVDGQ